MTCDELIQFPATRAARGEPTSRASGWAGCFGREGTPDICPGRPRGAGRGPGRHTRPAAPSLHHRNSARISCTVLENGGFLIRESPGGGTKHRFSRVQADWEASPGWAGASGLFWTAIWRVAASFSDRGGTQNSDRPWGSFNAAASQSGWSDRILSETGRGLGTCSNRTVVVQ